MTSSSKCDWLNLEHPKILELLDVDPQRVRAECYECFFAYAVRLSARVAPQLGMDDREEFASATCTVLLSGDMEVLKSYRPLGSPFRSWLTVVLTRRLYDWLDYVDVRTHESLESLTEQGTEVVDSARHGSTSGDDRGVYLIALTVVRKCFRALRDECQLLIKLDVDGFRPRDIATALPNLKKTNRQISDALAHCRDRLRECVESQGVDLENLF